LLFLTDVFITSTENFAWADDRFVAELMIFSVVGLRRDAECNWQFIVVIVILAVEGPLRPYIFDWFFLGLES
jgi:hypothetical protein